ncbi:DICT sensory domain-containing protein [Leptolyngbyaceae cyanobacterium UHCC 1019]
MSRSPSILEDLLVALPDLRPQIYFKSSLTALSHAMEDQVLAGTDQPVVIASFQRERFYRQEAHRYLRIADRTEQVYVLAAPETDFANRFDHYETIAFDSTDALAQEWHLVVVGSQYAACLICRERQAYTAPGESSLPLPSDQSRRFEGIWTFERSVACKAAELLLAKVLRYRPELANKVATAQTTLLNNTQAHFNTVDPGPFAERLVTYIQAGQYKLLKVYRSIAAQEQRERLVNSITSAIRRSLDPDEIFKVAVQELGQALHASRCLIYRCRATDTAVTLQHESLNHGVDSLIGHRWNLADNPLFQFVAQHQDPVYVPNTQADVWLLREQEVVAPREQVQQWAIAAWLMVPVVHQNRLLGMVEVHHCSNTNHHCSNANHDWHESNVGLIEAIANQIGVALIQAEAYANLEDLNQQLAALDRTRSNLIAITGHELRTPLSTIQVCLESLSTEPDMPEELRQVMLNAALTDAERMRKLIQDFLTLSQLESGRIQWHVEPLPLQECVDLALSSLRSRQLDGGLPEITAQVSPELPLIQADGEWVVEVLSKLLDNACKFTEPTGKVVIQAQSNGGRMLEVTVSDTGRGIESNRLETVFDRFYQEEGALRRSTGGTGLGLAICRQIVVGLGGRIWAESAGKDRGSQFHLTLPISSQEKEEKPAKITRSSKARR